ncbi:uncharacterized protein SCHCODRAFT_02331576 [Schizophyllum commune H4-8]|uniref:uncharacterized protein n=1 Tax=Schizophyllum commune (strain H4-8 / FGSC 9210) TaxID=578458 RepID=UPI0021602417|nr:uncharacterized protein SCHCODRAFT_02331576 [Schizophyllum commune H4-8]KAI5889867.1 hypothetical protein SCHCODRAFT_02331576 [Schizophyllum commune H4-8]
MRRGWGSLSLGGWSSGEGALLNELFAEAEPPEARAGSSGLIFGEAEPPEASPRSLGEGCVERGAFPLVEKGRYRRALWRGRGPSLLLSLKESSVGSGKGLAERGALRSLVVGR